VADHAKNMLVPSEQTRKVEALWYEMSRAFRAYPEGVVRVPEPIMGTAFFPGGIGLLFDGSDEPQSDAANVMVVGNDFNTLAAYEIARQRGSEFDTSQTWRNIRTVFPHLGLSLRKCFFTNFYMGLRERGPETGRFPGARDRKFVQYCARFFERQMEVIRPQLIVTLGLAPLKAIGKEVFQLQTPNTLSECVDVYRDLSAAHGCVALVALTHPSLYFANVRRRRFLDRHGLDAERAMVQHAVTLEV
jgi:uracil-DNA glycosylase family 4